MGWLWTAVLNAGLGVGGYLVSRHGLRQSAGWPRTLAAVVLGWVWLTIGLEALGTFGLLARGPMLGWVVLGILTGLACRAARRGPIEPIPKTQPTGGWSWEEIVSGGFLLWASMLAAAESLFRGVKVWTDGPIYHLYFAARWWKAGRLELIAAPFGENAATYFPAAGDLWFSWLMLCWGGDRLAKVGQAPFLLLAALTVFALCRRLGAGRPASVVASAWFTACTPYFIFSFETNVDTILVAESLLSAYFFARSALGDDGPGALVLGALGAGLTLATKAPAIVFVPPLLILGTVLAAWRKRGLAGKAVGILLVWLAPLSVVGYWWGRNLILTGNPLYPLHLAAFGRVWLSGWYGPEVMRSSEYYIPAGDWRAGVDILWLVLDPRLAPVWLASVAGAWAVGRDPRGLGPERRLVWAASGLAVLDVALFWAVIPYRTQYRFMYPALGLAAVPLAMTFDRWRFVRWLGVGLLALHMLTRGGWPFQGNEPPWDLSSYVPNNIAPPIPNLPTTAAQFRAVAASPLTISRVAVSVFLGALSFVTILSGLRAAETPTRRRGLHFVLAASTLIAIMLATMYPRGVDPRKTFFTNFSDSYRGWLALDLRSGPLGTRVAYAGTDLPYYLMGVGLRNDVRYVNVDEHRDWLLHDYHREARDGRSLPPTWPDTRPAWDRLHLDYAAWLANLRHERIKLLVVTRTNTDHAPHSAAEPEGFPIERVWADAHPESFEPIYGPVEGDRLFRIYRVKPSGP